MKHTYAFLLLAFLITGLSSCKKETDPYATGPIVGKWNLKKRIFTQTRDGAQFNQATNTDFNNTYIQFNADQSGMYVSGTDTVEFKWNILRKALTLTQRQGDMYNVVYSSYTIKTLNNSDLNIQADVHYTRDDNAAYIDSSDEYYSH